MHGKVLDQITAHVDDYLSVRVRLRLYLKGEYPSKPGEDKHSSGLNYLRIFPEVWSELSEWFSEVSEELREELNESIFQTGRDSQEYFYLGKVEKFFRTAREISEVDILELEEMKKGTSNQEALSLLEDLQNVSNEIDTIREYIAEHFEPSYILDKYPDKFPSLTEYVKWVKLSNDVEAEHKSTETDDSLTAPQPASHPSELEEKDTDMKVKMLIAHQSGLLTGTFHQLPPEKQYAILGVLLNRSKANIKNTMTAMFGNANTDKNPRNLPKVVEKANDLIAQKDLGLNPIKGRKE